MKQIVMMFVVVLAAMSAFADWGSGKWTDSAGYTWPWYRSWNRISVGGGGTLVWPEPEGDIVVPSIIPGASFDGSDGYVVQLNDSLFSSCTKITSVKIPDGVETIGRSVFWGCKSLSCVYIPDTVISIGESAFYGCKSLTDVCIPDSVVSIGECAFQGCLALRQIKIPKRITEIAANAYRYTGLRAVEIPDGVTTIGEGAFGYNYDLEKVIIPSSVTNIDDYAFENCTNLTCITIPASVRLIGGCAFSDCPALQGVVLEGSPSDCLMYGMYGPRGSAWGYEGHTPSNAVFMCNVRHLKGWTEKIRRIGLNNPVMPYVPCEELRACSDKDNKPTVLGTNVVVHYVLNSVQPNLAVPVSADTGFVNIITEVKSSGVVAVPNNWSENYPNYIARFGSDFTKSLMKPTGKKDGSGNAMLVWQDYVAGTDPTDENDIFTASITTDKNGKLIISYTPELSDDEKAKRIYKTLGKTKLTDADWTEIPAGHEADYNFYRVTVRMK